MATIKAYTDIEQSRKLAKILPIESADMRYQAHYDNKNNLKYIPRFVSTIIPLKADIPCWSLASLLEIIPGNYVDVNDTICHPNLIKTKDGRYMVIYNVSQYTSLCNNPVDACYEMILKLHELNLL